MTKIPTYDEIQSLWNTYLLPEVKRNHSRWVAHLALWFTRQLQNKLIETDIDTDKLYACALLHDIDKNIPRLEGERHPDTGVRVLTQLGYKGIADVVRTHPLHAILDASITPKSWDEKILYLSDKMVKHEIISVDKRFALWKAESLPKVALDELDRAYPLVKALENEICSRVGVDPTDIARLASAVKIDTMMTTDKK
jgi:uncharacterized protein